MTMMQRNIIMKILQIYCFLLVLDGAVPSLPVLTGPDMAYLGSKATFQCCAAVSSLPVTYRLMKSRHMVATVTRSRENHPAEFVITVTAAKEGSYHCMVTAGGNTTASNTLSCALDALSASGTRITSEPDPAVLYEGSRLVLSCDVVVESNLTYTWFFNRSTVTPKTSPSLRPAGSKLVVERVTSLHAGLYSCMTMARLKENRTSSSREVQVTVKVFLSQPRITFSISKESNGYGGNVTCWTSRGSPPASFYLLLDGEEVASFNATESMLVTFPVATAPARDMGTAQCRVKTEVQELQSETLTLVVVPVGGHVKVEVQYLYGADSKMAAAQLHCLTSRGTFPSFSWLLNNSVLLVEVHPRPHLQSAMSSTRYGLVDGGRSLILTMMDPGESGSYRCRVRDSFDDSSPWFESPAVRVQIIDATLTTTEIISISFCCFLLLVLVVGTVCVMKRMGDCRWANVSRATTTNSGSHLLPVTHSLTTQRKQSRATRINYDVHNQTLEIPVQQDAPIP
ncbi:unnamed protein product [Lota lota]